MTHTYTVITHYGAYDLFVSNQSATTPSEALLSHAISQGHIASTPSITVNNIESTLVDDGINYIVVEGHTSIASFEHKQTLSLTTQHISNTNQ